MRMDARPSHDMQEVIVIRPSWHKVATSSWRAAPLVALVLLSQLWLPNLTGGRDTLLEAAFIAILLVGLIGAALYRMFTAVELTRDQLRIRTPPLRTRSVPRSKVAGVALRRVAAYPTSRSMAVIFDRQSRSIATLPRGIWEDSDISTIQGSLGSKDRDYRDVTQSDCAREFPGALHTNRDWIIAIIVGVAIVVGVAIQNR